MTTQASKWGYFADGTVHIICSSHNDIAWFDTPAATIAWRDERSITPALERMAKNKAVHFTMENVLYLLEYLERHPDRREEIRQLVINKRFDWGATYNQPYESLLSGEQLVREMYLGRKLVRKLLPGTDARVYYSPDVPARALQMPQILAKAGIPYMMISRHKPSVQTWCSPDGSRVTSWSMGHYGDTMFKKELEGDFDQVVSNIQAVLRSWSVEYEQRRIPPHFAFIYSMDYIPPKDFDSLLAAWEIMRQKAGEQERPPALRYSTPEQFLDAVTTGNPDFESICGERPNIWVYIHGPSHHHAISAKREAGVLIPAAETFSTIEALLADSFAAYPSALLEQAWADSIYDDHGWGGNNGFITDEVFRRKLVAARNAGQDLLQQALRSIASRIRADLPNSPSVVVFNDLSWSRTDPVTCRLTSAHNGVKVLETTGRVVPHQFLPAGNGLTHDVIFIAEDVPSIGYKTYHLVPDDGAVPIAPPSSVTITDTTYENAYYRVVLAPGGIQSLYDKQLQHEVIETRNRHTQSDFFWTDKFLGTEAFIMESVGNDAHEYGYIQQPSTVADFDKVSRHKPTWIITESGAVYTAFSFSQQLTHCLVVQKLVFYHSIKRIDCELSLLNWDATKSRELRLALPLNMPGSFKINYEVPMGVVEVGRDEIPPAGTDEETYEGGPAYNEDNRTLRPREVQNFVSASDDKIGVTMSSSVAAFDYLDPSTLRPARFPILQALLLASRKSCHSNGNWYVQGGDHHYLFSILSHAPGWVNGYRYGIQANHPLHAVVRQLNSKTGNLPSEQSFLSVSANHVLISALKKCEDDQSVIVRCYDIEGQGADCELKFAFAIEGAQQTNIIEEEGKPVAFGPLSLQTRVGHHAIETFKLIPKAGDQQ